MICFKAQQVSVPLFSLGFTLHETVITANKGVLLKQSYFVCLPQAKMGRILKSIQEQSHFFFIFVLNINVLIKKMLVLLQCVFDSLRSLCCFF